MELVAIISFAFKSDAASDYSEDQQGATGLSVDVG